MRATASLICLLFLASCGDGQPGESAITNVLVTTNAAKDSAMVEGDAAALETFYTADYQLIDTDGKVHRKRDRVEQLTSSIDVLAAKSADVQVRILSKNAALVTGRLNGRYRRGGREQNFAERYTRIWVTEDSQWRLRHEHSSPIDD
jgi:ketosteroid isomerase-like protein